MKLKRKKLSNMGWGSSLPYIHTYIYTAMPCPVCEGQQEAAAAAASTCLLVT